MSLEGRLLQRFAADHPAEAARVLGGLAAEEAGGVLGTLPEPVAAGLLLQAPPPSAAAAVEALGAEAGARLLSRLPAGRAVALLRRLPPGLRGQLLERIDGGVRLRPLLAFPEGTVGALMDPQVPALTADLDLAEARRRIGSLAAHLALELYLVGEDQRLAGLADLREVLAEGRAGVLGDLARPVDPLPATADARTAGAHPAWAERGTVPVVDERGIFLGALRAERLRQAVREADARSSQAALEAARAIGEIYRLGLGGVFSGLAPARGEEGAS